MKKTRYILFAAAIAIASVACTHEDILEGVKTRGESRTFTCSLDENTQTRTDITKQGKTVWKEGDRILVSNGTESDTLTVNSKYAGQKYFEFSTTLEGKIYVVYPCTAAKEIKDGKFFLEVPNVQNGEFGSANIACAVAEDRYVKMRNVTSVLRFKVPEDAAAPVKAVSINSVNNNVSGIFSVDMTSGSPVVSTIEGNTYSSDVTVSVDGNNGNAFYATVIPGTYTAGFTMTAVSLDLHNASESKSTVSDKVLAVNAYYDLGTIGGNLKPLAGEGTQGNPWQIATFADFLAFTYYVNEGNNMQGEYVKLMDNIKTVTTPVGYYDAAINVKKQFVGDFDGNGKTVTLNIKQTAKKSSGLFGAIAEGANIHDVTVEGTVYSTFDDAAGVCGLVNADNGATITNCVNKATVESTGNFIGGITGWVDSKANFVVDNCSNEGKITGAKSVGGICAAVRSGTIKNSRNSGAIEATTTNGNISDNGADQHGVGGIVGYMGGALVTNSTNSGTVTCVNKAGGIVGHGSWFTVSYCSNIGTVSSNGYGVNGGIVGSAWDVANVFNCKNDGEVKGTFKTGWTGGIVGAAKSSMKRDARVILIRNCENNGKITVEGTEGSTQGVGGIVGHSWSYSNKPNRVEIYYCTNNGEVKVTGKDGGSVTQSGIYVGGIVGLCYDYNNWTTIPIKQCLNTATISGGQFVGGVLGCFDGKTIKSRVDITNCENRGEIITASDRAGGILGGSRTNQTAGGCGARLENCLNIGSIKYANAATNNPYVGGIAGSFGGGRIYNCYTNGTIGPVEGTPVENVALTLGAVVGKSLNANAECSYSYYLDGVAANAIGTESVRKVTEGTVLPATADGVLSANVTVNNVSYSQVVDALNAMWPANEAYYVWTTGPKFSFSGNVGIGDGLDLGNGGKL